jgi:2-hydroxycyclohexanecarboxyl-CoA dehydrogenase
MSSSNEKPIIVTGGASGIGAAISKRLINEGYNVAIFDLNAEAGQSLIDGVEGASGKSKAYKVDITDHEGVAAAVAEVEGDMGTVWGLVNNAGWDKAIPFSKTDHDFWQKIINLNLYGALNVTHAALNSMLKGERGGRIVTVSSDAGRTGSSGEGVYSACKGGQIAFMKTLARENARNGITCNSVCPGPTMTPLTIKIMEDAGEKYVNAMKRGIPMGRLAETEDYPGLINYFVSEEAAYVTGQTISISGGLSMNG